jgi:hypothetical protein
MPVVLRFCCFVLLCAAGMHSTEIDHFACGAPRVVDISLHVVGLQVYDLNIAIKPTWHVSMV